MKPLVLLFTVAGVAVGVYAGPLLFEWSPLVTVALLVILLFVTSYYEVRRREAKLDRDVQERWARRR